MSIALAAMSDLFIKGAQAANIPLDVLHRVVAMASGGMDTLPHNGAVITLLAVTGLTHRESYRDIFAVTIIKTLAVFFVIAVYYTTPCNTAAARLRAAARRVDAAGRSSPFAARRPRALAGSRIVIRSGTLRWSQRHFSRDGRGTAFNGDHAIGTVETWRYPLMNPLIRTIAVAAAFAAPLAAQAQTSQPLTRAEVHAEVVALKGRLPAERLVLPGQHSGRRSEDRAAAGCAAGRGRRRRQSRHVLHRSIVRFRIRRPCAHQRLVRGSRSTHRTVRSARLDARFRVGLAFQFEYFRAQLQVRAGRRNDVPLQFRQHLLRQFTFDVGRPAAQHRKLRVDERARRRRRADREGIEPQRAALDVGSLK